MGQKIGVLILHGAGTPERDFAEKMIQQISGDFRDKCGTNRVDLEFEPVFWSSVFAQEQQQLWKSMQHDADLDYGWLRQFVITFLSDAVAYQPTSAGGQNYDKVHTVVAKSIRQLKERAGETAPLCVISHSLGSIVASNYFYDLQYRRSNIRALTKQNSDDTPIENCETMALFYSLGSPMALWSLRYIDFGSPITVPSPHMTDHYPGITGEWLNFYDKDDILAYPLKGLNDAYKEAVTEDVEVNAGGLLTSWNPLSHAKYDTDGDVISKITDGLLRVWKNVNASR
ncbi:chemotaxis protein [Virgibacillus siamensis]|uniref:chemotaxis protein n=1 Tax=Virgibacillus siamensis TaxID=480071 RepID=UPI00098488AD|nr:chemotaxis protein [Virgibacillus siamensis]